MNDSSSRNISLSLVQIGDPDSHSGLENVRGNRLGLSQTMSYFSVMCTAWYVFPQIPEDVTPIEQKPLSCQVHRAEYSQFSKGIC